jgi:hypothetical protein
MLGLGLLWIRDRIMAWFGKELGLLLELGLVIGIRFMVSMGYVRVKIRVRIYG